VPNPPAQADRYRVVRFLVKPGQESEFERFFTESLLPAAAMLADSPEALRRDVESFTLLRPVNSESADPSTYYVLYRLGSSQNSAQGEPIRDLVRRAFPPADAQRRVEQWMATIDLESLVPQGQVFERVIMNQQPKT
jgi:hypothetical protein